MKERYAMSKYKFIIKYTNGDIKEEANFESEADFNKTLVALRHMIIDKKGNLESFQAFIDNTCIENSNNTEYTVLHRDENGFPSIVGLGNKADLKN